MSCSSRAPAIGAVIAALVVAGCGEDEAAESVARPATASGFPVTVRAANGPVRLDRAPKRIVSLSPSATETLFAVGAGRQVVAVDDQSDFPAQAPRTKLSGYQPNVEAIAAYRPDLVVVSDQGPQDVVAGLEKLRVPVLLEPSATSLEVAYDQMVDLGAATGHRRSARSLVARTREELVGLARSVPREPRLTVFHELSTDLYSASSKTFIGEIYSQFGLRNIADRAARASSEYPKLSAEYVVAADPDLIVLADGECCGQTPAKAARRDGWRGIDAVQNDAVVSVSDDVASRWGPRLVDFARAVATAVRAAQRDA